VILSRTIKGKGVAYMEGDNRWHQASPSQGTAIVSGSAAETRSVRRRTASSRAAFGTTVVDLVRAGRDVMVVSCDTRSSMGLDEFVQEFPKRHVEVGIAEQNLMTVAAGLAAGGRTVFVATYAAFACMRALEQVRTFIAHPRLRVVIVAGLGGLSSGIEGVAHLAMEDLGILRCIPGLVILNPADAVAAGKMVRAAADHSGPIYIRLGRDESPVIFDDAYPFSIGRGVILMQKGWDAALMTTGLITDEVLGAAAALGCDGIGCTVIEFPSLKPFDRNLVLWARNHARALITIEEHSVIGGLGSAVMETLGETAPAVVERIGIPDCFLESGSPLELRQKFGLTAGAIAARIREICGDVRLPAREMAEDRPDCRVNQT
jgi:transketolase